MVNPEEDSWNGFSSEPSDPFASLLPYASAISYSSRRCMDPIEITLSKYTVDGLHLCTEVVCCESGYTCSPDDSWFSESGSTYSSMDSPWFSDRENELLSDSESIASQESQETSRKHGHRHLRRRFSSDFDVDLDSEKNESRIYRNLNFHGTRIRSFPPPLPSLSNTKSVKSESRIYKNLNCHGTRLRSFPPPLSSLSNSVSVMSVSTRVRSVKKNGRFTIRSLDCPSQKFFNVIRQDGRLQLRLNAPTVTHEKRNEIPTHENNRVVSSVRHGEYRPNVYSFRNLEIEDVSVDDDEDVTVDDEEDLESRESSACNLVGDGGGGGGECGCLLSKGFGAEFVWNGMMKIAGFIAVIMFVYTAMFRMVPR